MWDSLKEAGGIGLAAPQIGISKQLAVIKLSEESERYPDMEDSEAFVIFNPEITILDEAEQGFWEGMPECSRDYEVLWRGQERSE